MLLTDVQLSSGATQNLFWRNFPATWILSAYWSWHGMVLSWCGTLPLLNYCICFCEANSSSLLRSLYMAALPCLFLYWQLPPCFMSSTNHDGLCSCSLFRLLIKMLGVFTLWSVSENIAYSWLSVAFWTTAEPGSPAGCSATSSPWFPRFS